MKIVFSNKILYREVGALYHQIIREQVMQKTTAFYIKN